MAKGQREHPERPPEQEIVGLFSTCLVNFVRPQVADAAHQIIRSLGYKVERPRTQTCCGQPGYSGGILAGVRELADKFIREFGHYDHIVAPSGSCAHMIKEVYPSLYPDSDPRSVFAKDVANKTYELTQFVHRFGAAHRPSPQQASKLTCTFHDGCTGLRGLGIKPEPRAVLRQRLGLRIIEASEAEVCCGFGGAFCVKYPGISARMAQTKIADILATHADHLYSSDLGCLLQIAEQLPAESPIRVFHVAEAIAGHTEMATSIDEAMPRRTANPK